MWNGGVDRGFGREAGPVVFVGRGILTLRRQGSPDEEVVGAVQMFSKVDRERDQLVRERPHKQDATSRTTHQQPQQPTTSLKHSTRRELINNSSTTTTDKSQTTHETRINCGAIQGSCNK